MIVADFDVVKEAFSALGRYRVLYHAINGTATLQLRIRGALRLAPVCLFRRKSLVLFFVLSLCSFAIFNPLKGRGVN